jgi:hypothetical protein
METTHRRARILNKCKFIDYGIQNFSGNKYDVLKQQFFEYLSYEKFIVPNSMSDSSKVGPI